MLFEVAVVGRAVSIKFAVILEDAIVVVAFLRWLFAVSVGGAVWLAFEAEKFEAVESGRAFQVLATLFALNGCANPGIGCGGIVARPAESARVGDGTLSVGSTLGAHASLTFTDLCPGAFEACDAAIGLGFVVAASDQHY